MAAPVFVTAVLLGGGRGKRTGDETPKQFLDLAGRPMVAHALGTLDASPRVSAVVVVLPEDRPRFVEEHLDKEKLVSIATGGPTRQASLSCGLECLPEDTAIVLVHDAARPLVTNMLIEKALDGFDGGCHGVVCAIRADDAIKEVSEDGDVLAARNREGLWRAQTPQVFLRDSLEDALARADADGIEVEDCSELLTRVGYRVRIVEGDPWNLKVTRPTDIALAEAILTARVDAARLDVSNR